MPTNKKQSVASVKDVKRGQNKETRRIATVQSYPVKQRPETSFSYDLSNQT